MTTTTVENIRSMEAECADLYEESTKVWTKLIEDVELQEIGQKLQVVHDNAQKFKEVMSTLPPIELVTKMKKNRKLY